MDSDTARIIHISALSQALVELIEESIYDEGFRHEVKRRGKIFISTLDTKLNLMLGEEEAAKQILDYSTILSEGLGKAEKELVEILKKEKDV